jgi:molybdate transport system ATP-binding protein
MLFVDITVHRPAIAGMGFLLRAEFSAGAGVTALFGPSGAGKSTVLRAIAGLLRLAAGRITVGEETLFDSETGIDLSLRRRRVGYVFQDLALFPHMSALSNVTYGLRHLSRQEREARALAILDRFGLAGMANRRPTELSGGQQQRVALARALITDPRVLLLDEPLSALDAATKRELLEDLRGIARDLRIPILFVTHDRDEVLALAAHVIVLNEGCIVTKGEPLKVLQDVSVPTLARLSGVENSFVGEIISKQPESGTMTCRIDGCHLDVPYTVDEVGQTVRIAIRAGDIMVSTKELAEISARNRLSGRIQRLEARGYDLLISVECAGGTVFQALITREAERELNLRPGQEVWLVIKTHTCYIVAGDQ